MHPPGVPQQNRPRHEFRRGRGAAARADAGLLRLFRLAQLGPRSLAADAAQQALPGCGVRSGRQGGSRPEPDRGTSSPGDAAYLAGDGRASYERPYGLAWLLCLAEELRTWDDEQAQQWSENLAPLEAEAADRFRAWLPKLYYPIRTGEHSQTAFAFGLVLDWAERSATRRWPTWSRARPSEFYLEDEACPLSYEPSGQDFLSPCIAEADLMRRILPPGQFAGWLENFLPQIPTDGSAEWLPIGVVTDRSRRQAGPPRRAQPEPGLDARRDDLPDCPRTTRVVPSLQAAADAHRKSGLASVTGEHYEGGHWLGQLCDVSGHREGAVRSGVDERLPFPSIPNPAPIPVPTSSPSSRAEVERSDAVVEGSPEVGDSRCSALSGEFGGPSTRPSEGLAPDDIKEGRFRARARAHFARLRLGIGSAWQIWIDTGGTFTDCIARRSRGRASPLQGSVERRACGTGSRGCRRRRGSGSRVAQSLPDGFLSAMEFSQLGETKGATILGTRCLDAASSGWPGACQTAWSRAPGRAAVG